MKKLYTLMTIALLAVLSMSFASCNFLWNDDDEIAYTLEGTWQGNMYVSSEWNGRVYDATYSEICFLRDPYRYSSGKGYWVDYYDNYGWGRNYVANHIDWTVEYGTIKVYFVEERVTIWIEDYRLNDNYFTGVIYDGSNRVKFRLRHVDSPNWYNYEWGWNDYYYAKPNDMTRAAADNASNSEMMPKRFIRAEK